MIKEIDKLKEPPQIAIKFANIVFVLGILFSILLIVYAIYKIYNPPEPVSPVFYIFSILCSGIFATLFGFGLKRLSNNLKVNLSVLFFTVGITVYGFETCLEFRIGASFDKRTNMEVLNDLRDSGIDAFPNIYPHLFIKSNGLKTKKGKIYPLGTIPNSTTIFKNEGGFYPIIEIDEHGFNNPKGLYSKNKVDIILTGDSFTEGYSVHSTESISAVLRKLNFNVINIGKAGNGPLTELAAIKEYAEPLKPKIVLWLYYTNDFRNLADEMESSILRKYLNENDYSQKLILRQDEIEGVLRNYINNEWEKEREKGRKKEKENKKKKIISIVKLTKLRILINLKPEPISSIPMPLTSTRPIFKEVLLKSKQMVSGWGGKMYIVYLPSINRYLTGNEHILRDFFMQTITELNIPIIDIHKEVFEHHQDVFSLFPFRKYKHYNAEGYRLVTEAIGKRLEKDRIFD